MNEFTNEDFNSMLSEMESEATKGQFVSPYWKPSGDGTTKIRLITPLQQFNEKLFYQKMRYHYINNHAYLCPNQTLKDKNGNIHEAEACPVCAKSKQLYNISQKGSEEWTIAGQLRAKDRYVSRVVVRGKKDKDGNDDEAKPEFWEFGQKIHEYFFNAIKMGEYGNFLSLKEGRDYILVKKGTGRSTSYDGSCLSVQQSPIFTDKEKLLKLVDNLQKMDYSQLVQFVSVEELKAALDEHLNTGTEETPAQSFVSGGTPEVDPLDPYSQTSVNPTAETSKPEEAQSIDDILNMI